jgi:hypothetical protein
VKIDVETKPITITTRVFTLNNLTQEEWDALKYAVARGADNYASRRALRGQTTPVGQLRRLLADMESIDDVVKPVDVDDEDDEDEGDEDDFDEED